MRDVAVAAALLAGLVGAAALLRRTETVEGSVRVVDGDTLAVAARRIRLPGLDAPERDQSCQRATITYPCGREASAALRALTHGRRVVCRVSGRDRYGRDVAACEADGRDLGEAMVRAGWAVSLGRYAEAEENARAAGRGIWAGSFERPSDWRREHPRTTGGEPGALGVD